MDFYDAVNLIKAVKRFEDARSPEEQAEAAAELASTARLMAEEEAELSGWYGELEEAVGERDGDYDQAEYQAKSIRDYANEVDGWRLYSPDDARYMFGIVPTGGGAVVIGQTPGGITVSGVLDENGSGELAFEAFDEHTGDVLAAEQFPAERCEFLPGGYAQAVTDTARIEDATVSERRTDLAGPLALRTGKWHVSLVLPGASYGIEDSLTYSKEDAALRGHGLPMVEIRDMSQNPVEFPSGQLVACYYSADLLGVGGSRSIADFPALSLSSEFPEWTIEKRDLTALHSWLTDVAKSFGHDVSYAERGCDLDMEGHDARDASAAQGRVPVIERAVTPSMEQR